MSSSNAGRTSGLWVFALAAVAGFGAVYLVLPRSDNATPQETAAASPPSEPAATTKGSGKMVAFVKKAAPQELPDITFTDGEGKDLKLSDFKGRTVLLNLWATWCAPCRQEMPALDRLQQALGSDKFEVVALSLDRQGIAASKKFLDEVGAKALKLYVDATAKQGLALKIVGMPTTILIDKDGREVGRLAGEAEWDSEDAKALIKGVM
jgi:thiol-disulfide isomerase/thioredoxin